MFVADMPSLPPSTAPVVMVAQATTGRLHVLGMCSVLDLNKSSQYGVYPVIDANMYFGKGDGKIDRSTAEISILKQPLHGRLEPISQDGDWTDSRYLPDDGYLGHDSFVMQVERDGRKVELHYFVFVTDDFVTEFNPNPVCKSVWWKMSSR